MVEQNLATGKNLKHVCSALLSASKYLHLPLWLLSSPLLSPEQLSSSKELPLLTASAPFLLTLSRVHSCQSTWMTNEHLCQSKLLFQDHQWPPLGKIQASVLNIPLTRDNSVPPFSPPSALSLSSPQDTSFLPGPSELSRGALALGL